MAYVYGLRANDGTEYFYIGSTKHALQHRLKQHLDYIRLGYNKNRHLCHKVAQVGPENVVIEAIEECGEAERFEREYAHIQAHLGRGVKLTNAVLDARSFELQRQMQEYNEFELQPYHMIAITDAYEFGCTRNGDALHDAFCRVAELMARNIFEKHSDEFLEQIDDVMAAHYEPEEANRQAASLRQRVLALLERG